MTNIPASNLFFFWSWNVSGVHGIVTKWDRIITDMLYSSYI